MNFFNDAGNTLLLIGSFVGWSALLVLISQLLFRFRPGLRNWPVLWIGLALLALVPLIPVSSLGEMPGIPSVLQEYSDSEHYLFIQASQIHQEIRQSDYLNYVFSILLGGLLLMSLYTCSALLAAMIKIRRITGQASPLDLHHYLSPVQTDYLISKNIHVRITDEKVSAFVSGLFNPVIILPRYCLDLTSQQLTLLVEHEIQHIKKGDCTTILLLRFYTALCCMNPFIRYLESRFIQAMELRCDRAVLKHYPNFGHEYAQTLLLCLKQNPIQKSPVPGIDGHSGSFKSYKQRIQQALSCELSPSWERKHKILLISLAVLLAFLPLNAKSRWLSLSTQWQNETAQLPLKHFRVSSGYSDVSQFRGNKPHQGVDLVAPRGSDVNSILSGQVLVADCETLHKNYGKVVLVEHSDGKQSVYAHLDSISVKKGQWISIGDKVGTLGNTGRTTGPHLHLEVLQQGARINPGLLMAVE